MKNTHGYIQHHFHRFRMKAGAGYTLIEILVSIAIIGIMLAVSVGSYSFGKNFDTLKSETSRFVAVGRNVRIRDFNGIATPTRVCSGNETTKSCLSNADCTNPNTCSTTKSGTLFPANGYGIHINDNFFVCSNDSDRACTMDADCQGGTCTVPSGQSNYFVFADFANPDGGSFYDGGKFDNEFVEEFKVPKNFIFKFQNPSATQAEILFKNGVISVYEYTSSWTAAAGTSYTLTLDYESACSSQRVPKKGQAVINFTSKQIYDSLVAC